MIVDKEVVRYVVFKSYTGDAEAGGLYTSLRFKVLYDRIDLTNIHVEPGLRGRDVAERLVQTVSAAHPDLPMSFSGTNGHSRRLARKLAHRIPLFDAKAEDQQFHFAADLADGFYAEVAPPVRSPQDELNRLRSTCEGGTAPPTG